jgi:FkbM family methyltransferase
MTSSGVRRDLIFDIGLHTGGDTAHYLRQGYRVVAVEANPQLAAQARRRFAMAIESGRLSVLNVGIAETTGVSNFWICDLKSEWSSLERRIAGRRGSEHHAIEIPKRRCAEILDEYGTPYYMKIDIEGNDELCVRALAGRALPPFLSIETECLGGEVALTEPGSSQTLNLLHDSGYRRFKLIFQRDFSAITSTGKSACPVPFETGNSGPWGDDTPGEWLSFREAREALSAAVGSGVESWHDWHAAL